MQRKCNSVYTTVTGSASYEDLKIAIQALFDMSDIKNLMKHVMI